MMKEELRIYCKRCSSMSIARYQTTYTRFTDQYPDTIHVINSVYVCEECGEAALDSSDLLRLRFGQVLICEDGKQKLLPLNPVRRNPSIEITVKAE
jgi:DNA-directed RNA polymerase subunit RPC12/RpoP